MTILSLSFHWLCESNGHANTYQELFGAIYDNSHAQRSCTGGKSGVLRYIIAYGMISPRHRPLPSRTALLS